MTRAPEPRSRQGGVALVTVLLVVAIATVMAVSMVREQQAAIQATRGFLDRGQAAQYALGGEELARQILFEDFAENPRVDHLAETWADPALHFEFEEGEVNLQITDLQGLINLNGLADGSRHLPVSRQRLLNFVAAAGADQALIDRVQDWIDPDAGTRPAGAEDFEYLIADPPYRAGNTPLVDTSEIDLLGLDRENYAPLRPYLAALPETSTALNINTAPPEVLQSLATGLTLEVAGSLAQRRDEQEGFETVQLFLQAPELAGLGVSGDGLGVQSSFFEARIIARYKDRYSFLTSIIHRNPVDGSMQVIFRDFSRQFRPTSPSGEKGGDRAGGTAGQFGNRSARG